MMRNLDIIRVRLSYIPAFCEVFLGLVIDLLREEGSGGNFDKFASLELPKSYARVT